MVVAMVVLVFFGQFVVVVFSSMFQWNMYVVMYCCACSGEQAWRYQR